MQHSVVNDPSSVGEETPDVPPVVREVLDDAKTLLDGAIHNNREALGSKMDVAAEYMEEERFLEDRLTHVKARNANFMPSVRGMKRNYHTFEEHVGASTPLTCVSVTCFSSISVPATMQCLPTSPPSASSVRPWNICSTCYMA